MIYFILTVCLCLMIDAIYVMYLYNKTDNFIYQKDKEAKQLEQKHLAFHRRWNERKNPVIKKDKRFNALKRKLGGA